MRWSKINGIEELALQLFDIGAVKDKRQSPGGKGFRLKLHEKNPQAPLSPFYLNLRTSTNPKPGPLTPELFGVIGEAMYSMAAMLGLKYRAVAGIPRAGDPFADAFVHTSMAVAPVGRIRLAKHEGQEGRSITSIASGTFSHSDRVLLVDDLITKADTKLEAIGVCERANLFVIDIVVLVDREQGGAQELRERGYRLHALFTISELLDLYLESGRMPREIFDEVKSYLAANR